MTRVVKVWTPLVIRIQACLQANDTSLTSPSDWKSGSLEVFRYFRLLVSFWPWNRKIGLVNGRIDVGRNLTFRI